MKMKTENLTGRALDYAVAICEGWDSDYLIKNLENIPEYSTEWGECGPLIDEYFISLIERAKGWCADRPGFDVVTGKTAKEAVCRAIAIELDDEIEIPDELIKLWDE
ncbi:DUF2591 domain-containing protein [Photorhabdus temperata]|uniref:DUF2591 domain-containing protein n=1 Tax=Photorhabdus temperata subsp. temperata Meg1 TaxID=1393735 RepID=A0A081RQI7_PHOTE|nr:MULTISPECIES: phage protein NinX family protein [Photorhabdus]KER00940.1 hypothetical protein MEG1DRAFT_04461 [Photorhabdus temperata subsp. temperata Meg1]MCC8421982.1 DUF2591 family protein [Photorhabdus thracensis]MCT8349878.1 DUF2591 domain-containing protein [Photorhabdus temperata]